MNPGGKPNSRNDHVIVEGLDGGWGGGVWYSLFIKKFSPLFIS